MPEATIFQIEAGVLAFSLVDPSDIGPPAYDDTWMAPGGKTLADVALADYDSEAATWSCQVTSGMLTAAANANDITVPATFCQPSKTVPQPGETSYSLDVEFLQDVNISTGLSKFLFENDTFEAYFLLGLVADPSPPRAIGRVRLLAGSFGGAARETLTATLSLPCSRKPQIEFGDATTSVIVTTAAAEDETMAATSAVSAREPELVA